MRTKLHNIPHIPKPFVGYQQTDCSSCGLAVTAAVLHYFGDNTRLSRIKSQLGTCRDGTHVGRIISRISCVAPAIEPSIPHTPTLPQEVFDKWLKWHPHNIELFLDCFSLIYTEDHFVLGLGGTRKNVYVMDPGYSLLKQYTLVKFLDKYKYVYPTLRSIRTNDFVAHVF